jgi:hypothetical protein
MSQARIVFFFERSSMQARIALAIVTSSALALVGCAESQVDGVGGSTSAQSATSTSKSGAGVTGATTTTGATGTTSSSVTTGGGPGGVVINEMSGSGDDFIELFNAGADTVDLSGIRIADQDTPGVPKLTSAVTLPDGMSLPAGSYLFILGGQATSETAPQTTCAPGPAPCFWASYKLSNKNGDEVFLVDKSDKVIQSVTYPGNLTSGETWSRLPNGTGPFGAGASTPGAANHAP